jgi:hypothetical protein
MEGKVAGFLEGEKLGCTVGCRVGFRKGEEVGITEG